MTERNLPTAPRADLEQALAAVHKELADLERLVSGPRGQPQAQQPQAQQPQGQQPQGHPTRDREGHLDGQPGALPAGPPRGHGLRTPAWLQAARGEERWPVTAAIAVAILLEIALPAHLDIGSAWLLPSMEVALAVGLTVANPRRIDRASTLLRTASVVLIALISLTNGWATYELIMRIVDGTMGNRPGVLLETGACIYVTNVIVFALWYWEWDRGGPVARAVGTRRYPDFLFTQMTVEDLVPEGWRPTFIDYAYLSYTNATAFSPADTVPLARWAKLLMTVQSAVALVVVVLVIARAIGLLR